MNRIAERCTHLSAEEMGELLDQNQPADMTSARLHLATCTECAAELDGLRDTLALFRESASTFASQQLAGSRTIRGELPTSRRIAVSPQLIWAAAALVAVGVALPLRHHEQRPAVTARTTTAGSAAKTGESDQALMEDIDRDLSAGVPESLQPLASPAASSNAENQPTTIRKN